MVVIAGRCAKYSVEYHHSRARVSMRVATTRSHRKGEDWETVTTWHDVVMWGDPAERAHRDLEREGIGCVVVVSGQIESREYVGNDGAKKIYHGIRADAVMVVRGTGRLGRGQPGRGDAWEDPDAASSASSAPEKGGTAAQIDDDDMPF
jgi:single stranded DNA-binding protein